MLRIPQWSYGRRSPAAPVTGCYSPHILLFCMNTPAVKPFCSFVFPPLAAVGRACPAVLRVMLRLSGIAGNNHWGLKPHYSDRRSTFSLPVPSAGTAETVSIPEKNQTIKKLRRIRCIERLRRSSQ